MSEVDQGVFLFENSSNGTSPQKKKNFWSKAFSFLNFFTSIGGFRFDRWNYGAYFVFWLLFALGSWIFQLVGTNSFDREFCKQVGLVLVIVSWFLYFGTIVLFLGTPLKNVIKKKWGEAGAYMRFEVVVGVSFLSASNAFILWGIGTQGTLHWFDSFPLWVTNWIGTVMFLFGMGLRYWATAIVGIDAYFFRDMFVDPPPRDKRKKFVKSGPYKFLKNPMYGLGYLHAYGFILLSRSFEVLVGTLVFHLSIYLFYFIFERAHIRRVYLSNAS